ncbi:molybdopterin-containing oxidoreductase family protein [Shewanella sp.]|uniref:molybdopterin-containing oxidoreductase family protein n=1 Tax=Shewanella sp. TaxID=50422 RepID=UPI003A9876FC
MERREFLKKFAATVAAMQLGEVISLMPNAVAAEAPLAAMTRDRLADSIADVMRVPSVCLNCSNVCGMDVLVKDDQILGVEGSKTDPNPQGKLCAKAHGGVSAVNYPERIVYPLKRVGERGSGLWQRITMEEAYEMIAANIKPAIAAGHPERVVFHGGRNKIGDIVGRFMNAVGSPVVLNHRALCSANKRAANLTSIGDKDWETVDAERCRYFLNFGSNFLEAHQGGFPMMRRYVKAKAAGAKMVTFDVRLSNTAGRSDEWHAPFPASEGAVALAMAHVIVNEKLYDAAFINNWMNVTLTEITDFLAPYTPTFAAAASGLAAKDISRLAREFAAAAPACVAFTNRGTQGHQNGFNNERAVVLLNALVGSVGAEGGYAYGGSQSIKGNNFPEPAPIPPKPKFSTDLEDPKQYPLSNHWAKMKVSELVFDKLLKGEHQVDCYLSYTISAPQNWPEGPQVTVAALKDEQKIKFHACSDVVYSEMAHYADLILPDATYFERYTIDARNAYDLQPYMVLRQPAVKPPFDCENYADTLINIAKRLGPDIAKYFEFASYEEFVAYRLNSLPKRDGLNGFDYMKKHGALVWNKPKNYRPFEKNLSAEQLADTTVENGVIYKASKGKKEAIGVMQNGVAKQGFKTPSRKFELHSPYVVEMAKQLGKQDDGWPHFAFPESMTKRKPDQLILTTFKWNVHTQGRTAPQKYLTEIVHDNPAWINSKTAKRLGVKSGDLVELTSYRPVTDYQVHNPSDVVGKLKVKVVVTEGIHPDVIAISNSMGMNYGGRIAEGRNGKPADLPAFAQVEDADMQNQIWWDKQHGGAGNGFNPNSLIPINPSPLVGNQSWNDTIVDVVKV